MPSYIKTVLAADSEEQVAELCQQMRKTVACTATKLESFYTKLHGSCSVVANPHLLEKLSSNLFDLTDSFFGRLDFLKILQINFRFRVHMKVD